MADDGGVLENLPRSRLGKRSEKRAGAGTKAAGKARATGAKRPTKAGATPRRPRAEPEPPPAERSHRDPIGGVIRGVVRTAGAGARVAGGVAREVLRRLPRP